MNRYPGRFFFACLCLCFLFSPEGTLAQNQSDTTSARSRPAVERPGLRQEILHMAKVDQAVRRFIHQQSEPGVPMDSVDADLWRTIDSLNTERMKGIVARHGWPDEDLVGEKGSHDAWLLVQHADRDTAFQKRALQLLRKAVKAGKASGKDLAYLTDRLRVAEGRPQVYGTQMRRVEKELEPFPVENRERLDERRKSVGLMPMSEYVKLFEDNSEKSGSSEENQSGE